MTAFVILAGLLTVGIVGALLYPLLRGKRKQAEEAAEVRALNVAILREQLAELEREHAAGQLAPDAYEKSRQEIERRVLEDTAGETVHAEEGVRRPLFAGALAVTVPALIVGLYALLGTPAAMTGAQPGHAAGGGDAAHALGQQQIEAMVQRLAERLQDNPNDGNGWLMLAKSYGVMGRFPESAAAYGRAITLLPPDAQVFADFADTVAMAQGRKLLGEPERIVKDALAIDPNNIKALALSGTIAFERQDYRGAIEQWRKILPLVPEGSQAAAGIQGSIRDAENRLAAAGGGAPKTAAAGAVSVAGSVSIDPALAAKIAPGDTLFIFARAVEGPKMPVAMARMPAGKLPASFLLDDSMSMTPNFKLSQQQKVVIGARISKSGDALPRAGDLEGFSPGISPGASGVTIVINSIVN